MDHIWNSLRQREIIWKERIKDEKNRPEHGYKQQEIDLLTKQLESIRQAMKEIHKWI